MPALGALDVRQFVAVRLGKAELFRKGRIERRDDGVPILAAVLDLVQLGLHVRRKADVHDVGEIFDEEIGDAVGDLRGLHILALFFDVLALVEHGDDRRVRRGTPDALVLHRLDEGSVGIAHGGLCELLLGLDGEAGKRIALRKGREQSLRLLFLARARGFGFLPYGGIAREAERPAARFERIVAVRDLDLHCVVQRFRHLGGDKALVNEFIDAVMLSVEQFFDRFGRARQIDGTDRLVRVLRALFGGVEIGLCGEIFLAVIRLDILPCRRLCVRRDARGVGTDIGDERDVAKPLYVDTLIEVLRHEHGLGRGHAEFVGSVLLQRARGERRGRVGFCDRLFDGCDGVSARRQRGERGVRLLLVADLALFALVFFQRRLEGRELFRLVLQFDVYRPIFFRSERLNLPFALDDEPERDGLHAPRRKTVADLIVQKGRELVTHEAVEHAARLLRVHEVIVDRARVFEGSLHRLGRDLVELDAVFALRIQPEHRLQMPRNGFALAVGVGCEIYFIRLFGFLREAFDDRLLPGGIDVARLVVVVYGDAELFGRKIADMPARSVYLIFPFQIARDGFCLARRLYDDEIHSTPFADGSVRMSLKINPAGRNGCRPI